MTILIYFSLQGTQLENEYTYWTGPTVYPYGIGLKINFVNINKKGYYIIINQVKHSEIG